MKQKQSLQQMVLEQLDLLPWVWAQSCLTLCNPMNCSPPGSVPVEFPTQEY